MFTAIQGGSGIEVAMALKYPAVIGATTIKFNEGFLSNSRDKLFSKKFMFEFAFVTTPKVVIKKFTNT